MFNEDENGRAMMGLTYATTTIMLAFDGSASQLVDLHTIARLFQFIALYQTPSVQTWEVIERIVPPELFAPLSPEQEQQSEQRSALLELMERAGTEQNPTTLLLMGWAWKLKEGHPLDSNARLALDPRTPLAERIQMLDLWGYPMP